MKPPGIYIVGTDTDIGKTIVSAGLMHLFRTNNIQAAYFKPVLSGALEINGKIIPGDTRFVKDVSGFNEPDELLTPYIFTDPVSPHYAARLSDTPIDITVIEKAYLLLRNKYPFIIAEAAGGLAVPFDDNGFMQSDLIKKLGLDCILVARAGLGTINHTMLTLKYAESAGIKIRGIVINNYTGANPELDNIKTIEKLGNI